MNPLRAFALAPSTSADGILVAAMTHELVTQGSAGRFEESLGFWTSDPGRAPRMVTSSSAAEGSLPTLGLASHPIRPLVAQCGRHRLSLYEPNQGALIRSVPEPLATAIDFGPDGQRLWGVVDQERIVSWSLPELSRLPRGARPRSGAVRGEVARWWLRCSDWECRS